MGCGIDLAERGAQADDRTQRLLSILEGTRAGTWEWNVQTGETSFNERWAEIVGYTLEELQPVSIDTWLRLTHPDDLARSNAALQAHFEGHNPYYECDVRMKHRCGNWVWIQDRGKVVTRDAAGQPLWMAGSHIEVTREKGEQEVREKALRQLQALARHVPGVLYQYRVRPDGTAHYPYASDHLADLFACSPEEAAVDGTRVFERVHPDDRPRIQASIAASAAAGTTFHEQFRILHPARGERWVEAMATPQVQEGGEVVWHGYSQDVTLDHTQQDRLRLAASVFTHGREAILITDQARRIVDCNDAFSAITGYTREESLGRLHDFLGTGPQPDEGFRALDAALDQQGHWQGEIIQRRKTGEVYATLLSVNAVKDEEGRLTHFVEIFSDISGMKQVQQELLSHANYDALTGLPNRRLLQDRVSQALGHARRNDAPLTVCMLDLDGFKPINDTHGHAAGDRLLQVVSRRLTAILRTDDTVARYGGDEFVLVLRDSESAEVFERILESVGEPVDLGQGVQARVTCSMGVTFLAGRSLDVDSLLCEADLALYQAKRAGRNRFTVFRPPA